MLHVLSGRMLKIHDWWLTIRLQSSPDKAEKDHTELWRFPADQWMDGWSDLHKVTSFLISNCELFGAWACHLVTLLKAKEKKQPFLRKFSCGLQHFLQRLIPHFSIPDPCNIFLKGTEASCLHDTSFPAAVLMRRLLITNRILNAELISAQLLSLCSSAWVRR